MDTAKLEELKSAIEYLEAKIFDHEFHKNDSQHIYYPLSDAKKC